MGQDQFKAKNNKTSFIMLRKPRTELLQTVTKENDRIWGPSCVLQIAKEEWSAIWRDRGRSDEIPSAQRIDQSFGKGSLNQ